MRGGLFWHPVNAYVTALSGIGKNPDLQVDGGAGTCVLSVALVNVERKLVATTGSDSVP